MLEKLLQKVVAAQMKDKDSPLYNSCHKMQLLIDHFRKVFKTSVNPEMHMSIDEQVVLFKGKHNLKWCLPKKLKKWGYKLQAHAGLSGYVYDFEVDGGLGSKGVPTNCDPPAECGEIDFVVLRLSNDFSQFQHELFFDNYFSLPELIRYLMQEKKFGQ